MFLWIKQQKNNVLFALLCIIAAISVWGNLMVTLSLILLAAFWVLQQPSKLQFRHLFESKTPLIIIICCVVFIVRCLFQLPSPDVSGEIQRWAIAALFLLIFGSFPAITHKQFFVIMSVFVATIVVNSMFNFAYFFCTQEENADVRQASIFMWYIRFALFCLVGTATCVYYLLFQKHVQLSRSAKILFVCAFLWLVFYLFFIKSITGYVGLFILSIVTVAERIRSYRKYDFLVLFSILFTVLGVRVDYEANFFLNPDEIEIEKLDTHTAQGNKYTKFKQHGFIENGHWTMLYICQKEIVENWHLYSDMSLFETNAKGFKLYHNLIRYMASKNLRKDAEGLTQLTPEDIKNIEHGYSNYRFTSQFDLGNRIYETLEEFYMKRKGHNPQGNSITQRFVFWSASYDVFLENKMFGVGPKYYNEQLHERYAQLGLDEKFWHQTHNQFLRILTTYGVVGFVVFLLSLLLVPLFARKKLTMLSFVWYWIFLTSMTNDDTFASHYGVMFVSLFCGLFFCLHPDREIEDDKIITNKIKTSPANTI